MNDTPQKEPIRIKKYANRRLYNTATSSYVTLDDLSVMVRDGQDFTVVDAKTNADITRSVLTQIIFEEESKGHNLLPVNFLRQLIALYGDSLQAIVPNYLEYTMQAFGRNQERLRSTMTEAMGGMFPLGRWEDLGRQNLAMFERALQMFTPLGRANGAGKGEAQDGEPGTAEPGAVLDDLKGQLDALRRQVEALEKTRKE
ncbi:MAG: polyhydroxyalkanoate synthesis repressor PhaR [Alphaproteobacteria bacterium]|nr:polyhydroxyalkanoate synthesis repressor PhaR [Alphaproteobacteria bacterium]